MRIVLDTNVLVSALISDAKPRQLLSMVLRKQELVLSREILEELATVVSEPKIEGYLRGRDLTDFLRDITSLARMVKTRSRFSVVREDPDDDIILRAAYDGKATYIVSGDKHLLSLGKFRRTRIVTVDEMIRILKY